jgi:stringent starvation protein B
MAESSTKPYLIRALYEWCCDNGYTPYLAVVVDRHTLVPRQHVKNGEIVLNVSPMATNHMQMGNELIEFQARFSGVAQQLSIPVENVAAIYARETGHGMAFEVARPAPAEEGGNDTALRGERPGADDAVPETTGDAGRDASAPQGVQAGTRAPSAARKRAGKVQGGADVIAFASPTAGSKGGVAGRSGAQRKGGAAARPVASAGDGAHPAAGTGTGASDQGVSGAGPDGGKENDHETGEGGRNMNGADSSGHHPDDNDEPPPSAGGTGGRARLTRVK